MAHKDLETSSLGSVKFCTICGKPFTTASTLSRHLSYCRRNRPHQKSRPRSCQACSQAKSKCSFEPCCSRCRTKNLSCVYERPPLLLPSDDKAPEDTGRVTSVEAPTQNDYISPLVSHELQMGRITPEPQLTWAREHVQPSGIDDDLMAGAEFLDFPADIVAETFDSSQEALVHPRPTNQLEESDKVIAFLQPRCMTDPLAQHSATLVMQSLRAYPEKMLSRENFPPFIHSHWGSQTLPEPLAVCVKIAQMFVSRMPDIESFLWRTIENEQKRFLAEVKTFSEYDLLAAMQAHLIYVIMCLVGESRKPAEWNRNMLVTFENLCWRLEKVRREPFCTDEISYPSQTWEDWVYAESRRRTAYVWFLMSRIVGVKSGNHYCVIADDFHLLPLPSPKVQWEARSKVMWHAIVEDSRFDMCTVGDLINAHRSAGDEISKERLDYWNARIDSLGFLLNIAVYTV